MNDPSARFQDNFVGSVEKISQLAACRSAIIKRLTECEPTGLTLDHNGYVGEISQNLIEGVNVFDFEADLLQGDGNEMETKFRAAYSSSALVVNAFARFKADVSCLRLPVGGRFTNLRFEQKCPHGLPGRRSPNLDAVAMSESSIVAIESKFLEPLTRHVAHFAPAYDAQIRDERRSTGWFREMTKLGAEPRTYHWLDAGQLIKHAFGLSHTFPNQRVTLLYLFWEPSNPDRYPVFSEHRAELARFASAVAGGGPEFGYLPTRSSGSGGTLSPNQNGLVLISAI